MNIGITGLNCVDAPKPNGKGDMIIAYFDFQADFVTMKGAALVQLASGGLTTWEPLAKDDRLPRRSVQMTGDARRKVAQAALPLFKVLSSGKKAPIAIRD
ncbi:hypothetical protein [Donghicola tyrosinivorans]|uniref:Uncharacterized protein n=1 Tax=Donghicola tyrosinivorans TaxID=1652492 RepID=A0A2T0WJ99_9RHOB|nr:hypothetical protein [Donghicola tyrosinivorans]PRY86779.1 hypothetical protein CLV74_1118 [Donghicola tyrosinivorans]